MSDVNKQLMLQFVYGTLHWQTHALLDLTAAANPPSEPAGWCTEGSLHVEPPVPEGLDNAALGLRRLFDGGNLGKQILHVGEPA